MTKKLLKRYTKLLKNKYIFHGSIFFFFSIVVFFFYRDLFFSYFESDEWFHFTYYLPLTKEPLGLLTAIKSTFIDSGPLSGGQHVIPIASAIFFLNTYFFGLNFAPYAFMSLLVHTVNCCLVFWLVRVLLQHKKELIKNTYAFFAGIFFQNQLSALLSILESKSNKN